MHSRMRKLDVCGFELTIWSHQSARILNTTKYLSQHVFTNHKHRNAVIRTHNLEQRKRLRSASSSQTHLKSLFAAHRARAFPGQSLRRSFDQWSNWRRASCRNVDGWNQSLRYCVCMNIHVHIYIYIYVCVCVCIHIYIHINIHIYIYIYIWANIHNFVKVRMCKSYTRPYA
jgi:hypothetical protein